MSNSRDNKNIEYIENNNKKKKKKIKIILNSKSVDFITESKNDSQEESKVMPTFTPPVHRRNTAIVNKQNSDPGLKIKKIKKTKKKDKKIKIKKNVKIKNTQNNNAPFNNTNNNYTETTSIQNNLGNELPILNLPFEILIIIVNNLKSEDFYKLLVLDRFSFTFFSNEVFVFRWDKPFQKQFPEKFALPIYPEKIKNLVTFFSIYQDKEQNKEQNKEQKNKLKLDSILNELSRYKNLQAVNTYITRDLGLIKEYEQEPEKSLIGWIQRKQNHFALTKFYNAIVGGLDETQARSNSQIKERNGIFKLYWAIECHQTIKIVNPLIDTILTFESPKKEQVLNRAFILSVQQGQEDITNRLIVTGVDVSNALTPANINEKECNRYNIKTTDSPLNIAIKFGCPYVAKKILSDMAEKDKLGKLDKLIGACINRTEPFAHLKLKKRIQFIELFIAEINQDSAKIRNIFIETLEKKQNKIAIWLYDTYKNQLALDNDDKKDKELNKKINKLIAKEKDAVEKIKKDMKKEEKTSNDQNNSPTRIFKRK